MQLSATTETAAHFRTRPSKFERGAVVTTPTSHGIWRQLQAGPGKKRSFFSDFFSLGNFDCQNELLIWVDREF